MVAPPRSPDRMPPGGGGEKLVSREEAPVDVNSRSGAPRGFPPLNQNSSPPPVASVSPTGPALEAYQILGLQPGATRDTMPNKEPRKIKALTVKGDAAENGGIPAGAAAPAKPDPLPDRRPRQLLRPSVTHRPPMPAPTHR
jgi:hypothetical protein